MRENKREKVMLGIFTAGLPNGMTVNQFYRVMIYTVKNNRRYRGTSVSTYKNPAQHSVKI